MTKKRETEQCSATISRGGRCKHGVIAVVDGQGYCKKHDPRQRKATQVVTHEFLDRIVLMAEACAGLTAEQLKDVAKRGGFKSIVDEFKGQ